MHAKERNHAKLKNVLEILTIRSKGNLFFLSAYNLYTLILFQNLQLVDTFSFAPLQSQPLQCNADKNHMSMPMPFDKVFHNGSHRLGKCLDLVQHRDTTQMLESKGRNSKDAVTWARFAENYYPRCRLICTTRTLLPGCLTGSGDI